MIYLYPSDFESKDAVLDKLIHIIEINLKEDAIIYSDLANTMTEMTGGIMDGITIVILIAFAGISLLVSFNYDWNNNLYICFRTYKGNTGILRALGARKKDITRVFNAETSLS